MKIHVYGAATQLLSLSSRHLPLAATPWSSVRESRRGAARQEDVVGVSEKQHAVETDQTGATGLQSGAEGPHRR